MENESLNCRCCGGELNYKSNLCVCKYCGATNFISSVASKYINQLNRANKLRQEREFDNAARIYDAIMEENEPTADILWFRTLCEYGIEYVPDPVTDEYFPTLHRINDDSIFDCDFFKQAIELSDDKQKETFQKEAKYIEGVRDKYLKIATNEDPYDVFICYKETDLETGEKTEDVLLAEELYNLLSDMGYKVFFARETLKEKLSIEYEPYIFAALKSAKAMAVIGTKAEYFTSVWVKNEWGRFFRLMDKDPEKQMFFACDDPEELPRAFAAKQAQILGEDGAIKNLARNMNLFLKGGKTGSEALTDQEKFNRIIVKKAKEYADSIEKTEFGIEESDIHESLLEFYKSARAVYNFFNKGFHSGARTLLVTEFFYLIYMIYISVYSDIYVVNHKEFTPPYILCCILIITFLFGLASLLPVSLKLSDDPEDIAIRGCYPMSLVAVVVSVGMVISIFINCFLIFLHPIIIFVIPFVILGGSLNLFNWNYVKGKKVNEEAEFVFEQLDGLEDKAKDEFFAFAEEQLEALKQSGEVGDDAKVKDYHYEEIRPVIQRMIEDDVKYKREMEYLQLSSGNQITKRIIHTIVYCAVAGILTICNLLIVDNLILLYIHNM